MTITAATGPGRVSQFMWGPNQENTITFSYPAALDNAVFWTAPQLGSEIGDVNDLQDAWTVGLDWYASMSLRWLLPAVWQDVQRFLDWAQGGGAFGFVPDAANAPLFIIPGCLLVSPFGDPQVSLEDNGLQTVDITFRNSTYDLGLSWR